MVETSMVAKALTKKSKSTNLVHDEEWAFIVYYCYDASKQDACICKFKCILIVVQEIISPIIEFCSLL